MAVSAINLSATTAFLTRNLSMSTAHTTSYFTAAVAIAACVLPVSVAMFARFSVAGISEFKIEITLVISTMDVPKIELVNANGIIVRCTSFL